PASGIRTSETEEGVRVVATIPTTTAVQMAWHDPATAANAISRAIYVGTVTKDAVSWTATFTLELTSGQSATLPLLPTTITLNDVRVDGKNAAIVVVADQFATKIQGR